MASNSLKASSKQSFNRENQNVKLAVHENVTWQFPGDKKLYSKKHLY